MHTCLNGRMLSLKTRLGNKIKGYKMAYKGAVLLVASDATDTAIGTYTCITTFYIALTIISGGGRGKRQYLSNKIIIVLSAGKCAE